MLRADYNFSFLSVDRLSGQQMLNLQECGASWSVA